MLFRPPLGEMMALSPDGHRVAYTTRGGRELALVLMTLEPGSGTRMVNIEAAASSDEGASAPLRFLRWATPGRLVFAPKERVVPLPPLTDKDGRAIPNPDGPMVISPVMAVDAQGGPPATLVDARDFQETPAEARRTLADLLRTTKELQAARGEPVRWRMPHLDILGFLPREREQLILRTRGAYSMPTQHVVDTRTGSVREFGDWPAPPGEPQVFDWFRLRVAGERKDAAHPMTTWRDAELGNMQRELETKFPRRIVEILDWSETRARVLFRVTGGSDPGRVFVFQRPEELAVEILRCAPWLNATKLNDTRFFEFTTRDGAQLSGFLTWPGKARLHPPPLLVIFPDGFPGHAAPAFDPEAQILADLGFVVARLNHRSVGGVRPEDLDRLRAAVDRVGVDDACAVLDWIAARNPSRPFDRTRVAALGRGFGGYVAVRALQLEPTRFRCAIALDAPMELRAWLRTPGGPSDIAAKGPSDVPVALLDHEAADWRKLSVLEQGQALTNPTLLLVERGRSPTAAASSTELRSRVQRLGRTVDYVELDPASAAGRSASRAAVYRKIDEFLTLHLRVDGTTVGATKEVR